MIIVVLGFLAQFSASAIASLSASSILAVSLALQCDKLTCIHRLLKDAHNSISAAQDKAVQRQQQLCLASQLSASSL